MYFSTVPPWRRISRVIVAKKAASSVAHVLRVHAVGKLGGAGEVGEEDGDDAALLPGLLGKGAQGDTLGLFGLWRVSVVAVGFLRLEAM